MSRLAPWIAATVSLAIGGAAVTLWTESYRITPGGLWEQSARADDARQIAVQYMLEGFAQSGGLMLEMSRTFFPFELLRRVHRDPHDLHDQRRLRSWTLTRRQPYPHVDPGYRGGTVHGLLDCCGFQLCYIDQDAPVGYAGVVAVAPCWFVVLLAAILPMRIVWRWRVRRLRDARARESLCPTCGYDLRATPGRCPECGAFACRQ